MTPSELAAACAFITQQTNEIVDLIRRIVAIESPSGDLEGSCGVVELLTEKARALSSVNSIEAISSPNYGEHSATPLQRALAKTLMADPQYYSNLRERFVRKCIEATNVLEQLGFEIYDSGSTFYIWARIPRGYTNAMEFNEMLMSRAGVAGVPGSAFADSDEFDDYMRFCIAREDDVLESALGKIRKAISG